MASLAELDVDRFLSDKPLALTTSGLEELRAHILARIAVFETAPREFLASVAEEMSAAVAQQRKPSGTGVGVIPIRGTLSQHARGDLSSFMFGGATTEGIAQALQEFLADDAVGKIVLDIDSPGGSTYGVTELAAEIMRARSKKPVVAVANSLAASAGYWIGAAADELYVTPGGMVGSIGVMAIHQDISKAAETAGVKTTLITAGKYKAAGNQFEPLDDDTRARVQARLDDAYEQFVRDVARGRGVTEAKVRNGFGEGDVVTAKAAKAAGMVDGIATIEQVIRRPVTRRGEPSEDVAAEADTSTEPQADEEAPRRLALMRWRAQQAFAATAKGVPSGH